MRSRFRPSHGTVVAYLALFVALGGTTYAATGGNFILGQPNGAGTPTQLTSGTGNAAGTLKVTNSASSGGRAIQGTSTNGQGVYGHSGSNAGVVGDSTNFDGVYAVSNSDTHAAVSAHNEVARGFGLWASGGSAHFHTAAIHGQSEDGNAIEGYTTANPASGVYGQDNNANSYGVAGHSDNGVAVVGDSSNGWAMQALGNATQTRTGAGFPKAMAYVDAPGHPADPIRQCFNSQLPPGQATAGNCGIAFKKDSVGAYRLHFGFRVDDRFLLGNAVEGSVLAEVGLPNDTNDAVGVVVDSAGHFQDSAFWIYVF